MDGPSKTQGSKQKLLPDACILTNPEADTFFVFAK